MKIGGFKLHNFEIYNWGTFDNTVWKMEQNSESSLLTGDNGSGKSTLVDGLLTLLVPNKKRNYNLSSGSEKRERSELTYIRGAYGKEQNEFNTAQSKYLRTDKDYSVLLATFKNLVTNQIISIGQVFWSDTTGIKKLFLTSHIPISIEKNFSNIINPLELKNKLKKIQGLEIYQTFSDYEAYFLQYIGIDTSHALDLFNQITSIKEIGKLSSFVRAHMLEKTQIKDLLDELYKNYEDLSLSHKAIVLAKNQLEQLIPLEEQVHQYKNIEELVEDATKQLKLIPLYFESKKEFLLNKTYNEKKLQLQGIESEITACNQSLESLESQKMSNLSALNNDNGSMQIEKIDFQLKSLEDKKNQQNKNIEDYNKSILQFKLESPQSQKEFLYNFKEIQKIHSNLNAEIAKEQDFLFEYKTKLEIHRTESLKLHEEIQSLKNRKNQLPHIYSVFRDTLCEKLDIKTNILPFVAELFCIKPSSIQWSYSVEKLLYGFALRLLVPDEYVNKVHKYMINHKLNFKLVYHNIDLNEGAFKIKEPKELNQKDSLYHKLEFRPKMNAYTNWVKNKLLNDYDFQCVEDLKDYNKATRAITKEGLIKRGYGHHEKDDRVFNNISGQSILGWDNFDRVSFLSIEINKVEKNITDLDRTVSNINNKIIKYQAQCFILEQLLNQKDFGPFDLQPIIVQINELKNQRKILSAKNINAHKLKENLDEIVAKIKSSQKSRDSLVSQNAVLKSDLKILDDLISKNKKSLEEINSVNHDFTQIQATLKKEKIKLEEKNLSDFDLTRYKFSELLESKIHSLNQKKNLSINNIVRKMSSFKNQFSESTTHLDSTIEAISGFIQLKQDLEKQSLPEHEIRFKNLLNKSLVNDLLSFKSTLELSYEKIEEDIKNLNASLKQIPYSENTFVQLCLSPSKDVEIREFQNMLKNALNISKKSEGKIDLEESFIRIKKIIDRLKGEDRWSSKVTDVRQWADFFILENFIDGSGQKNFYSDSSGLSGGQKVKLAFTILASAIAHQYGLHRANAEQKSFRFIVIDEAFSKSDEKNSRYAMQLFTDLGLQIMVVTPKDKIYVVEPFVKNIFLTQINEKLNTSNLLPLKIKSYYESKSKEELATAWT